MAVNTDPRCPRCGAYLAHVGPHHMTDCGRMTDVAMHVPPLSGEGSVGEGWQTIECERVFYVDRGKETILCDRLPSPVTLLVKLAAPLPAQEVMDAMVDDLRLRLKCCEFSLGIFDEGHVSEYWLRYPKMLDATFVPRESALR